MSLEGHYDGLFSPELGAGACPGLLRYPRKWYCLYPHPHSPSSPHIERPASSSYWAFERVSTKRIWRDIKYDHFSKMAFCIYTVGMDYFGLGDHVVLIGDVVVVAFHVPWVIYSRRSSIVLHTDKANRLLKWKWKNMRYLYPLIHSNNVKIPRVSSI